MIGIELMDKKCPRCGGETCGSSAKGMVFNNVVSKMIYPNTEIIFYVICAKCGLKILPKPIFEK